MSSSQPGRPSSSASVRPASSASLRPSTSLSTVRPLSRLSRPQSRHAKQNNARIAVLSATLVSQLGADDDQIDWVQRTLSNPMTANSGSGTDMEKVEQSFQGHAEKARVRAHDILAEALEKAWKRLHEARDALNELDGSDINPARIPDHLSFLLGTSRTPSPSTLTYASLYPPLPEPKTPPLTWQQILADEPYEEEWPDENDSSSLSDVLSPLGSSDLSSASEDELSSSDVHTSTPSQPLHVPDAHDLFPNKPAYTSYAHRREVEDLQARQYWRDDWHDAVAPTRRFDIGDETTLGLTLQKILPKHAAPERYIYEEHAVREFLMMLQGRASPLFAHGVPHPRLRHFSRVAQESITSSIVAIADEAAKVRVLRPPEGNRNFTLEAFADAVKNQVHAFDSWCAEREAILMHAGEGQGTIVSLLDLEKALHETWAGVFSALVSIKPEFHVLDELYDAVETHRERGEDSTAAVLQAVLRQSSRPLWGMLKQWLIYGEVQEREFFIESNTDIVQIWESEYWKEGFLLRERVPRFLEEVKDEALSSGKGVGLLRVLKLHDTNFHLDLGDPTENDAEDTIRKCSMGIGQRLVRAVTEDCGFYTHLKRIEDVFFWRGEDGTMSLFADVVFAKMDTGQNWTDFHFLNTAFRDTSALADLVRLSYRSTGLQRDKRSIRALEGLNAEYAVPFPLTYIFGPEAMEVYGEVFVLLMQVRRAKWLLDDILVRSGGEEGAGKVFWAMRGKLSCQLIAFHKALRNAGSLDDIINMHTEHLDKIQGRCLLQANTSALRRPITTILDMCVLFGEIFISFKGDTSTMLRSTSVRYRHRSRRQRKIRKNVIGFCFSAEEALPETSDSSDEEEDEDDLEGPSESNVTATSSFDDTADVYTRIGKMEKELDGLVRFVRRGAESLAGSGGPKGEAFGVLAFALEDWDL